jgi:hypothetical protein
MTHIQLEEPRALHPAFLSILAVIYPYAVALILDGPTLVVRAATASIGWDLTVER